MDLYNSLKQWETALQGTVVQLGLRKPYVIGGLIGYTFSSCKLPAYHEILNILKVAWQYKQRCCKK